MGRRVLLALLVWALLAVPVAVAAAAGFDDPASNDPSQQFTPEGHVQRQDTPNDPDYDRAENPDPETSNLYDERFDLFGFPSKHTALTARYKDGPNGPSLANPIPRPQVSGFNAAGAWKLTRGRGDVSVAVLDTGVRWNSDGLRTKVRLNADELPPPQPANASAGLDGYDLNGNAVVDVDDYANDPRVGNPQPTGQDLIRAFSNGDDADGNGFVDDIAGWDFFDDDNDPDDSSSYFAASGHGTGRAREAVERANDGEGSLGVCPKCQFLPIRIWDTFVSDGNSVGLGMLYATDAGASVIVAANGSLYHSAFTEAASEYAYERGVVQTYSGDDLNTANHNYPANYSHAMLIQGVATDTQGLGQDAGSAAAALLAGVPFGTELPVQTYFRGANTTQFGGKSSLSMEGTTGSQNTGKAGGAAGLVISAAREAGITLKPDETRAILEQTAEDVTPLNTLGTGIPDPAQRGWDSHFGWGRVNLGAAVAVARSGKIPPEAAIDGPDWYAPLTGDSVEIKGLARSRAGAFQWKLEWGVGQAPTAWTTAAQGSASGTLTSFGSIDLAQVREALEGRVTPPDTGGPVLAPGAPTPFDREWTVRLTVTSDGIPTPGVDRRVLNALDDETLRPGFPKRMGTGGEAPIRYADLNGDDEQELLVPLEDGTMHAYRPDGSELPGWPVSTRVMAQAASHAGAAGLQAVAAPAREPLRAPTITDFDDDGRPEIVSTAGRHIYAWDARGELLDGFPVPVDPARCRPQDQTGDLAHRKCGFIASPAVGRIEGPGKAPVIVAPALDGHVYAVRGDGSSVPGYPKELVDPGIPDAEKMRAESINQPAIGDLNGDGTDDVVVATNETYGAEPPSEDSIAGIIAQGISDLLANAAGGAARVYALDGPTGNILDGWPIAVNGAIQTTLPLVGPGHDPSIATIGGERVVVASATGSTSIGLYRADGTLVRSMQQNQFGPASNAVERDAQFNLFESAVVGDVLGAGTPAVVKYGLTLGQAANLLLVGQNAPYHHLIGAYDGTTGEPLPAWPTITDDYQFLSSSAVAKIADGVTNQVVAGTALGLLHAYDGATGRDVGGFPKYTGGWLYSPAALSDDGRIAAITREGYLFEWTAGQPACQAEWPDFRHDQQGTGNYDADGTPPGAVRDLAAEHVGGDRWTVSFTSPGDDRRCGTPAAYEARVGDTTVDLGEPVAAGEKLTREVTLPAAGGTLRVRARDEAGNRGFPDEQAYAPGAGPEPTPTPDPGGGGAGGGSGPSFQSPCIDALAPRSRFRRSAVRATRRGVRLAGASRDRGCGGRLASVYVAINRALENGRCRSLLPSGRLRSTRSCHRTVYLRARGTASWRFRLGVRLPPGRYKAWVRGVDAAGNVERKNKPRNLIRFRVRRR